MKQAPKLAPKLKNKPQNVPAHSPQLAPQGSSSSIPQKSCGLTWSKYRANDLWMEETPFFTRHYERDLSMFITSPLKFMELVALQEKMIPKPTAIQRWNGRTYRLLFPTFLEATEVLNKEVWKFDNIQCFIATHEEYKFNTSLHPRPAQKTKLFFITSYSLTLTPQIITQALMESHTEGSGLLIKSVLEVLTKGVHTGHWRVLTIGKGSIKPTFVWKEEEFLARKVPRRKKGQPKPKPKHLDKIQRIWQPKGQNIQTNTETSVGGQAPSHADIDTPKDMDTTVEMTSEEIKKSAPKPKTLYVDKVKAFQAKSCGETPAIDVFIKEKGKKIIEKHKLPQSSLKEKVSNEHKTTSTLGAKPLMPADTSGAKSPPVSSNPKKPQAKPLAKQLQLLSVRNPVAASGPLAPKLATAPISKPTPKEDIIMMDSGSTSSDSDDDRLMVLLKEEENVKKAATISLEEKIWPVAPCHHCKKELKLREPRFRRDEKHWHPSCLVCGVCKGSFDMQDYDLPENQIICKCGNVLLLNKRVVVVSGGKEFRYGE